MYDYLDTLSISAATITHYHFVRWTDGNTMNPRNIIITSDTNFTAIFAIDTHSVSLQVDSIIHGFCNGNGNYVYGTAATAVAIPYSGYLFSHWSNGSTYNPYNFAVVGDTRLTAYFRTDDETYQDTIVLHDTLIVHDTTYLDRYIYEYLHDTIMQYINHYIHDTTYINNYIHDTVHLTEYVHDTAFIYQYIHDTIVNYVNHYIHDTTYINNYIYDTIYLYRYIYDTVYIHDTIYIQEGEGIDNITLLNAKIYQRNGQIVVEGAEGYPVYLYDVVGRLLATRREAAQEVLLDVPASGAYLVKIGDAPARRIVVRR